MDLIQINGETSIYGIIGRPISHSFSPIMQTEALQELHLNAVYLPFLVNNPLKLKDFLQALHLIGVKGINITIPFKEAVLPYIEALSDEAAMLKAVNTLERTETGWKGFNTDGSGFIRSLSCENVYLQDTHVLLIGAGGAAKAVAIALAQSGVKTIHLQNRTLVKAEGLKKLIQQYYPQVEVKIQPELNQPYDLLINTTSVGMDQQQCPIQDHFIENSCTVVDIIYNPLTTPLLNKAQKLHKKVINGLGMLLYQGATAFEIWTKLSAPIHVMQQKLEQQLLK